MNDQTKPAIGTAIALPGDPMQLMALARELANARLIPPHFQKSPADCWLVMSFCRNRNLDFLMVVGECSVVKGRLFFSGKLTAALLNTSGYLAERLNYEYASDGQSVIVTGRLNNENSPRTVMVKLADVRTDNVMWKTQPEQQLAYAGARIWGRRHVPEVLMGLMFEGEQPIVDVTPTEVREHVAIANPDTYKEDLRRDLNARPIEKTEEPAPPDAEQSSGDLYALRWQEVMRSAASADELTMQWNSERGLRSSIDWHDREQPARLKEMVTRRIEELKASQDDTR